MAAAANASSRRALVSWALYDWANSAFATTVMAGFFPLFFKQYWSAGEDAARSTLELGAANSIASLLVAAIAPVLGALADRGGAKKRFLGAFAGLGVAMTAGLYFVNEGEWLSAVLLYAAASVGFSGSIVFYDSLLVSVARPEDRDRASALGYGLGYLGGGVLFAVNVAMALKPQLFGLSSKAEGVKLSFVLVAIWWALFTLPLMRNVREPSASPGSAATAVREGFAQLRRTLGRVASLRPVWTFLLAYWLYIDGVDTVVRMAVDYGLSLGLDSGALILALLITQFVGFPAAIAFGRLGTKIGTKRGILIGIAIYVIITTWGAFMRTEMEFYALAIAVGLAQGGVQALSRSFYSRLIPPDEAAEFFGFYNMLGKFAAIVGPTLMGVVSVTTGSSRLSILAVTVLLVAGGALLLRVDDRPQPTSVSAPTKQP